MKIKKRKSLLQEYQSQIERHQKFETLHLLGKETARVYIPVSAQQAIKNTLWDVRKKYNNLKKQSKDQLKKYLNAKKDLQDNWKDRYLLDENHPHTYMEIYLNEKKVWIELANDFKKAKKYLKGWQSLYDKEFHGVEYVSHWVKTHILSTKNKKEYKKLLKKYPSNNYIYYY